MSRFSARLRFLNVSWQGANVLASVLSKERLNKRYLATVAKPVTGAAIILQLPAPFSPLKNRSAVNT